MKVEVNENYIFNPTFGFVHYLTQFWVKTTQHCLEWIWGASMLEPTL